MNLSIFYDEECMGVIGDYKSSILKQYMCRTCDMDITISPRVYPRYGFVINFWNPPVIGTDEIKINVFYEKKSIKQL